MTTYVALLRAINVGGRRSLKMSDLKALIEKAGASSVTTYIQSGNVVFSHPSRSAAKLEAELEQRIESASGMEVPVVLRSAAQWGEIVAENPFPKAGPKALHVVVLKQRAPKDAFAKLDLRSFLPEEVVVGDQHLYLHLPNGMGRAKLPIALDRRGPVGTARNWATVLALAELAQSSS
jgi:uncharacterized protein (DUF1697 family)